MKIEFVQFAGIVVVAGLMAMVGCEQKTEPQSSVMERTGSALDQAAGKTVEVTTNAAVQTADAVKDAAVATKDATGRVIEKTGAAVEKAGAGMQE